MKVNELSLRPISLALLRGPLADQLKEGYRLRDMLDQYGFGFITDISKESRDLTDQLKQAVLPLFQDDQWGEVMKWPRRKFGELGPTGEGEERHLNQDGSQRALTERKRYISVDAETQGWDGDPIVAEALRHLISFRYSLGLSLVNAYEVAKGLARGTFCGPMTLNTDSHTTMRNNWYPPGGWSLDHTDTSMLTVLDYEPGIQIEHPQGSGQYVELVGAKSGDLIINLGDTFTRLQGGEGLLSTRHRVIVPDDVVPEGRVTMPLFIATRRDACFPDGVNIYDWAAAKFKMEGAADDRG